MPPTYYRGCWHVVSRGFFLGYRPCSSPRKGLYIPKDFVTHAASLHQGCPHCAISLIAAPRRSQGRVAVPVWLTILSDQLPVDALVSRHLTNKLIGRRPIPERIAPFGTERKPSLATSGINPPFGGLSPSLGQVAYVLLNRLPLEKRPKSPPSLDLHTLGTPLAFVLSQDQTLHPNCLLRRPKPGRTGLGAWSTRRSRALRGAVPLQAFRCCPTVQFSRILRHRHKKPPQTPGERECLQLHSVSLERGGFVVCVRSCLYYTRHAFFCQGSGKISFASSCPFLASVRHDSRHRTALSRARKELPSGDLIRAAGRPVSRLYQTPIRLSRVLERFFREPAAGN